MASLLSQARGLEATARGAWKAGDYQDAVLMLTMSAAAYRAHDLADGWLKSPKADKLIGMARELTDPRPSVWDRIKVFLGRYP